MSTRLTPIPEQGRARTTEPLLTATIPARPEQPQAGVEGITQQFCSTSMAPDANILPSIENRPPSIIDRNKEAEEYTMILEQQVIALKALAEMNDPTSRKHKQQVSKTNYDPPAKKRTNFRMPKEEDLYSTVDFATFQTFIHQLENIIEKNKLSKDDMVSKAVGHFDGTLLVLWKVEKKDYVDKGWQGLCKFLEKQLGDPDNCLQALWSNTICIRPRADESYYAYLKCFQEGLMQISNVLKDLDQFWFHVFLESLPRDLKYRILEQKELPKTPPDLVALVMKLQPNQSCYFTSSHGKSHDKPSGPAKDHKKDRFAN
ncbi:hypothetical protein BJX99DRAFT_264404 [Aspergillus californicus]